MLRLCITVLLIVVSLPFCQSKQDSEKVLKNQLDSVNRIVVRLPGKVSDKGDDILAIISDDNVIVKVTSYINEKSNNINNWESESDRGALLPQPFLDLQCYRNEKYVLSFGIGIDFFSSLTDIYGYRVATLPQNGKKEFLGLINISEEEYDRLYKEWLKPGPWKKKP